jgi:hypothetical protein
LLDGGAECGAALPATMFLTIIRFQPRFDEANAVSGNEEEYADFINRQ